MLDRIRARQMPELLLFPHYRRRDLARSAWASTPRRYIFYVLLLCVFVVPWTKLLPWGAAGLADPHLSRLGRTILDTLTRAALAVSIIQLASPLWLAPMRRYLRHQLQAGGVPICLKCGYNLQGQMSPRCPECGSEFDKELLE